MPITIQQLQGDPTFLSLPDAEKLKGLGEVLPGFSDLPSGEQQKALADFRGKGKLPAAPPSSPKSYFQQMNDTAAFEGFPGGEAAADMAKTGYPRGLLPMAGSLVAGGGMLALSRGQSPGAAVTAGMAGAGAGSAVEDWMLGAPADEEMAKRAAESAIFAGIAPGFGTGVERAASTMAKGVKPDALRAVAYARANNLPIDVAEISPSWVASLFSGDLFAAGRYKTKQYARDANEYLIGMRSKILETLTGAPETVSIPIASVGGQVKPLLKAKTTEAYETPLKLVTDQMGDVNAAVRLENMRRTAGEMLQDASVQNAKKARYAPQSPVEWLTSFLAKTEKGGGMPFTDLHQVHSQLNKVFYGAGHEGAKPLFGALADDLVVWDARVGGQLNEAYSAARASSKNEKLFDTVYGTLRAATDVDKNTGAEILNGARLKAKLQTQMKTAGWRTPEQKILESLGPDEGKKVIDDLYAIADYATGTKELRSKVDMKVFDPTTLLTGGASVAPGMLGSVPLAAGIAVPQGSSLMFTVLLSGPGKKGFLRNWLLKEGHPGLRLNTRVGVQFGGEQLK